MGDPIEITAQPGLIDDFLSPKRLRDSAEVKSALRHIRVQSEGNNGRVYLHNSLTLYAVALAVAGYITLQYDGDGAVPRIELTQEGRALLQ